jgi:hypothetical protein
MKARKRRAYLQARIKDYETNLMKRGGYTKPGSQKK